MSKFHSVRVESDGIMFDSLAEERRYQELKLLAHSGDISDLEIHPKFPLVVNGKKICTYIADFRYTNTATHEKIVEDVKGVRTPQYVIKKKLMCAVHGITITETGLPFTFGIPQFRQTRKGWRLKHEV